MKEEAAGRDSSGVYTNAEILGRLFAKWFGSCASKGGETKVSVGNASKYADRYALEAGFRRRASRMGVPNARAAWFARDAPQSTGRAEGRFYEAASDLRLPDFLLVAPYRMVGGMPSSGSLWGSLYGEWVSVPVRGPRLRARVLAGFRAARSDRGLWQSRHDYGGDRPRD